MNTCIYDSELRVMEVLWEKDNIRAVEIGAILSEKIGWNINTTYTIIKKCIEKGYIQRTDPKFWCHALVSREDLQNRDTENFIERCFHGSTVEFLKFAVRNKFISPEELRKQLDL